MHALSIKGEQNFNGEVASAIFWRCVVEHPLLVHYFCSTLSKTIMSPCPGNNTIQFGVSTRVQIPCIVRVKPELYQLQ